jgi:hypothetical protein
LCRLVALHMAQWPDRIGSFSTLLLLMHGLLTPIFMLSCLGFCARAVAACEGAFGLKLAGYK